ncbi:MAG: cellulase family glycosylhydrolase [Flavobacteriales bacterium]|nr:cellulase family glycosylhydrolase [Flavobacteriales bacterium]
MKKYIYLFLALCLLGAAYFIFPLKTEKGRVKLIDGKFELNKEPFYPVALNYIISVQSNQHSFWATSCKDYQPNFKYNFSDKLTAQKQLRAEMKLIKELGFNTVRLVGMGEAIVNEKNNNQLAIRAFNINTQDTLINLENDSIYDQYFNEINDLFTIIEEAGLKVIFLVKISPVTEDTKRFLRKFSNFFRNNTTLLAVDVFNEPLYFDKPEKEKKEVYDIVKDWRKTIKMYAPNLLVTIGLEGIREVFRWDPTILDVDFISYHPYEYEPEQVRNEIYWYGKYTEKPWIIGETAIPANNDSITYEAQRIFAKKTLEQTYNCGGVGYSWWHYKDVDWHKYHANFMGILTWEGQTLTANKESVYGTIKPLAKAFVNYTVPTKKDSCICLDNYYNYTNGKEFRIVGTILNEQQKPIEGAVILAWNENWTHSYHTITKADGSFELLGTYPFYHWITSAVKHSTIRGDINPDTARVATHIPTINLGKLKVEYLPFIKK